MFKSKVYRLFCFLFAFSLVFVLFGVEASAASDNLISSDLSTWSNWSDYLDGAATLTVTQSDNIYRVTGSSPDGSAYLGAVFGDSSLIAGHSYSLSFKLPDRTEVNSAFNKDYSSSVFQDHFSNCYVTVGVGYITSSGEFISPEQMICFAINPDNYTKYFGKALKASFIASNYSGTPVAYICISSKNNASHSFYFSDFKLVDNDDNSAELTGIKGFLHSIRWDLVGGTCEEEDCPHSSAGNPHLSLSERMSSGFALMFQNIGDKFEEGSTLNTWFTNLANKVGNLDGSLSNLGDRFKGFIDGLGESLSIDLGNLETSVTDWFDDLKKSWDQWIDEIQQTFDDVGVSIENKFQEISDGFTEFFEKFKPVVSFNFDWKSNVWISTSNGLIYESESYSFNAAVTDFFEVSEDFLIKFDFKKHPSFNLYVFQYNEDGGFVKFFSFNRDTFEYVLSPGYKYRFYYFGSKDFNFNDYSDLNDFCGQYLQVYCDEGWVNALLYKAKMGLRSLFVPDEAFIVTWKEEMDSELEAHLGFLYQIPDFTISYVQVIRDTLKDNDTIEFTFPEIEFEFNGEKIHLWDAIKVDFSFLEKEPFSTIYSIYKVGISIIFGAALFMYGKHVWKKVMSN